MLASLETTEIKLCIQSYSRLVLLQTYFKICKFASVCCKRKKKNILICYVWVFRPASFRFSWLNRFAGFVWRREPIPPVSIDRVPKALLETLITKLKLPQMFPALQPKYALGQACCKLQKINFYHQSSVLLETLEIKLLQPKLFPAGFPSSVKTKILQPKFVLAEVCRKWKKIKFYNKSMRFAIFA